MKWSLCPLHAFCNFDSIKRNMLKDSNGLCVQKRACVLDDRHHMLHFCYLSHFIISAEIVKIRFHSHSHCTWQPVMCTCCYTDISYSSPPHTHTQNQCLMSVTCLCLSVTHALTFLLSSSLYFLILMNSTSQANILW